MRREINLTSIEKLRDLNRECEQMFKDNIPMTKIAKHYQTERKAIEKEQNNGYVQQMVYHTTRVVNIYVIDTKTGTIILEDVEVRENKPQVTLL